MESKEHTRSGKYVKNYYGAEKIKLVIVINDFLIGGAQRLTAEFISHLDRDRFEVTLVTLFQFPGRADMYHLLPEGLITHKLQFRGFADLFSWSRLWWILRKERPHVVLSNLFFSNVATRVLQPLLGYRCIVVEHNTYTDKTRREILCDRLLSHVTERIVAVSPTVKAFTVAQERIPEQKFVIIGNGLDIEAIREEAEKWNTRMAQEKLELDTSRSYIINVGRLAPQKDHALLLEGFARFAKRHPDYDLIIVGDGGLRDALRKQAETLDMASRVRFMGSQSRVIPFYCASEFFVSTSKIEGFGLAHAEALACGLPLVSTKTAGPDLMIEEGKNGFFILEETPAGVARALERMVEANPTSMRAYAREVASRYDIGKTVKAYEALIEESVTRQ